jgi:WS/DGAT/MGAT family acyltransferase
VPPPDRLSALDLSFLDLETPEAPLHIGWTMRVDGSPPPIAALRRHIDSRLEMVPRFRRTVAHPALGFGDPHWVDDPAFDIAHHVHALTLAPPAGPAELRELAGTLFSQPLDHTRPLWRVYLVGGLASGGFAVIGQAHHALVDGIAAIEVAMLLFDVEPDPSGGSDAREPAPGGSDARKPAPGERRSRPRAWSPAPPPSNPAVARSAAVTRAGGATRGTGGLLRALANARPESVREAAAAVSAIATPAPRTTLDRTAGPQRAVGYADVSLEGAREAGRRHDATINDVYLAAATIALGRALRRRGDHPATIKAMVPVNVRGDGAAADLGNRISFVTVELPVAEPDPVRVLRRVRFQTRELKSSNGAGPLEKLADAADLLPGPTRRVVARAVARATPFNVVVSNVPGPQIPLYLLGRRVTALYPAVPITMGHSISIGAVSYRDRLHVGLYADVEVIPDAVDVVRDLEAAFDALRLSEPAQLTPWRARARARRDRQRALKR